MRRRFKQINEVHGHNMGDRLLQVGARRLRTAASVGVALSHAGLTGPDDLPRLADAAMYEAKRRGGGFQLHGAPASLPLPPIAQPLSSGV